MNRELKQIVNNNTAALKNSSQTLQHIYEISFSGKDYVMAEENDGFRIHRYTYRQMDEKIQQAAAGLYQAIGETHRWVGLAMDNSVNWIVAFWGILKSGNKPYLINSRHPDSLTAGILTTLNISTVVCDRPGNLPVTYLPLAQLPKGEDCPAEFENELAIATSATSLKESICIYSGKEIAAQILNTEQILKDSKRITKHYKGQLKQLAFLPFYHIFGLFAVYFWFTFYQRTLVFLRDMAPRTILATCRKHQVTHVFAVPLLWHTIETQVIKKAEQQGKTKKLQSTLAFCTALQNVFPYLGAFLAKRILSSVTDELFGPSIQFCISGGSFIRSSALYLFNGLGYALHNGYGMSEIGIASVELRDRPKHRNLGTIGKPFTSVAYRLDDSQQLWVKGDSLCNRRIVSHETLATDGWLLTGDLAQQTTDGSYAIWGRQSDLVIGESGENINPDLVEPLFHNQKLLALTVLGLEQDGKQELALIAQVHPYANVALIREMHQHIKRVNSTLPLPQQVRRFYVTTDQLMADTAIKISRAYVKRGIQNGSIMLHAFEEMESKTASAQSNSPLQQQVLQLVASILNLEPCQVDPNAHIITDLGASSLQYFSILQALAEEFHISADDTEQYVYTVREFCDYIERHLLP